MSLMTRCACRAVIRARATCSNVSARFCAFLLSVSFVLRCTRVPSAWIKQANQYLEPRFLRIDATSPILFRPKLFFGHDGNQADNILLRLAMFGCVRLPMYTGDSDRRI